MSKNHIFLCFAIAVCSCSSRPSYSVAATQSGTCEDIAFEISKATSDLREEPNNKVIAADVAVMKSNFGAKCGGQASVSGITIRESAESAVVQGIAKQYSLEFTRDNEITFWEAGDGEGGSFRPIRTRQNSRGLFCRYTELTFPRQSTGRQGRSAFEMCRCREGEWFRECD